ncbi:MAG: flagellin [Acetatifactor sp.]|nr:flagellin [Acetatifactor sp.]
MSMSIGSINSRNSFNIYSQLSSGKRINRAADDASGLAIAQKLLKSETGFDVGAQNARDGMGALNVADGAMGGIMDYLQRIDELSIRSMNGLYSDSDRQAIQSEINGMMEGIQSLAKGTSLNEQKLLDGSMADLHLATNPSGGGLSIQMENTTLKALGLAGYNVTGDFDLSAIGKAMDMVSKARTNMGASTNRLEHTYNYNRQASENLVGSRSRIEDLDMPKAVSEKQKQQLLGQYRNLMLRRQMNDNGMVLRLFQ